MNRDGQIIWNEDAGSKPGAVPRTDPPRHAEDAAGRMYDQIAMRTGSRRPNRRIHWSSIAQAAALFGLSYVVYRTQLDVGFLHLGSILLFAVAFVLIIRGIMGYGGDR